MDAILPGLRSAVNLHPMVVHFPIAFGIAATLAWGVAAWRKNDEVWRFGLWLHSAGLFMALVAVAAGYLGTSIMGHHAPGHSYVHVHRDIMLGATGLSMLVTSLAWWRHLGAQGWRVRLLALSCIQALVMIIGADRGGLLVYHMGIGVDSPPSSPPLEREH